MPKHSSKTNSVRIFRRKPCPEFALKSKENEARYGYALLHTINPDLDFEYISRLEVSVSLDFAGLPAHHHAVAFHGKDVPALLKMIPTLEAHRSSPPHQNRPIPRRSSDPVCPVSALSVAQPLVSSSPPAGNSSQTLATAAPTAAPAAPAREPAQQKPDKETKSTQSVPEAPFTVVARGPSRSSPQPPTPVVATANRFDPLAQTESDAQDFFLFLAAQAESNARFGSAFEAFIKDYTEKDDSFHKAALAVFGEAADTAVSA